MCLQHYIGRLLCILVLISLALQIWKLHIKTSSGLKTIIKLIELFGNRCDSVLSILEKNQKSREMTSLNMKNRRVENLCIETFRFNSYYFESTIFISVF